MTHTTMRAARPCLFFLLSFIAGIHHHSWADEYPSPPDVDTPAVSPDGKKIVFTSDNITRKTTIWIANRDGGDTHPLVNWNESIQTDPDWSPDGQYIVFVSNRESQHRDIWRIDADGHNPIKLTSIGSNSHPRFSPDGTKILFKTNRTGRYDLWYMSFDGSEQRPSELPSTITIPNWSPDGSALVYSKCAGIPQSGFAQDMECNLFIYSFGTGAIKQLTSGKARDSSPDWGALGIVFNSNRNVTDGILMVDETGNNLRQITTSNDLDLNPRWDHTTDTIVFASGGNRPNIWSTDIHGNETQLTHFGFDNHPPIANAGPDQTVECTGSGKTDVKLDGSLSSDPDDDPLSFVWTGSFGSAGGPSPNVALPLGSGNITLTVTDGNGGESSDETVINVADTTPPVISTLTTSPASLSPPDHRMLPVTVTILASDVCSPTTTCNIVSVKSNEPINGLGDGDTTPDWEITDNLELLLRAERSGAGRGRLYTITLQCYDATGNSSSKETVVAVP